MVIIPVVFTEFVLQLHYRVINGVFLSKRAVIPIYTTDGYRYYRVKSNISYKHKSNEFDVVYYTNNQGFRTDNLKKDVDIEKQENVFRILFLGPSFTFGWANNYEDSFVSKIAANLSVKGKIIEVINLGTPAQPIGYQLC